MNYLYRVTIDPENEKIKEVDQVWCASTRTTDTLRTVCGWALDAFGCQAYDSKAVKKGGITCDDCLATIKEIKAIRL